MATEPPTPPPDRDLPDPVDAALAGALARAGEDLAEVPPDVARGHLEAITALAEAHAHTAPRPTRPVGWRQRVRRVAGLTAVKVAVGAGVAVAGTTGGLAATGNLPAPVQQVVSDGARWLGIQVPAPAPDPASPADHPAPDDAPAPDGDPGDVTDQRPAPPAPPVPADEPADPDADPDADPETGEAPPRDEAPGRRPDPQPPSEQEPDPAGPPPVPGGDGADGADDEPGPTRPPAADDPGATTSDADEGPAPPPAGAQDVTDDGSGSSRQPREDRPPSRGGA